MWPASPRRPGASGWRLVVYLFRNPLWLFGWVALAGAFVFQALALHDGHISVVQPLLATEPVFTLVLRRRRGPGGPGGPGMLGIRGPARGAVRVGRGGDVGRCAYRGRAACRPLRPGRRPLRHGGPWGERKPPADLSV
jgi:hypothetical protein